MRILLVNPNISVSITERLATVAHEAAAPGTQITALTAPRGVPYISCRAEAQLAGAVVLELLAEHGSGHDAALIAAFGDPGLWAARELFDLPVVGMAEAAMHTPRCSDSASRSSPSRRRSVTGTGIASRRAAFPAGLPPSAR
jgi:Asp/Glu/hydantoin racemase